MPSAPTQDTIDMVQPYLAAESVPESLTAAIFQALDAAGLTVVEKASGDPVVTTDTAPMERVAIEGAPGSFVCGVQLGTAGWLTWTEIFVRGGAMARSAPVFVAGERDFLA